jgi:hypothetical protein
MSDQIIGKVGQDMDPFKKILSKIPGFSGYIEQQKRRDADKILRDTLADAMDVQYQRISSIQKEMVNSGDIKLLDDMESAAIKLRTFMDRVRRAPRGYSSLFEAVKIREEELGRIYQFDAKMLDLVDQVGRAIDNVEASLGGDGLPAAIRNLISIAQSCIETYNQREQVVFAVPQG